MAFRRVRPSSLCRAQKLILQQRPRYTGLFTIRQFHRGANLFNSQQGGSSSGPEYQQQLDLLERTNKLLSEAAAAQNDSANPANTDTQAAASEETLNTEPEEESPSALESVIFGGDSSHPVDPAQSGQSSTRSRVTEDFPYWSEVHIEPYRPFVAFWLRDNCQCSSCINPITRQRMVNTFTIPKDIHAKLVENGPAETIEIWWSDGHTGVYPTTWLERHQFVPNSRSSKVLTFRKSLKYRRSVKEHPTVAYENVMKTGDGLAEWLRQIISWGYCLVKGVPVDPEATKELLERIAFIRHTHYGGFWDFTSDLTYKDTAYTSEALDPHTDNTYFSDPARLQLFHLLSHTDGEGGETLLVDGFYAAYRLLQENPRNVQALTDFPQPWHSSGNEDVCIQPYRHFPVLERDPKTSRLRRIRWNNYDRAAKVDWDYNMATAWYKAARHWNAILKREDQVQKWLQLEPGTALIFDNWRMLHGRSAFTGKRRMCGGYINNDDFVSRYRLLLHGRERTLNELGTNSSRLSV